MSSKPSRRDQKYEEMRKRDLSPILTVDATAALKVVQVYKKKAVTRMKTFYAESQRMDKKLPELLEKVESLGFHIGSITLNEYDKMCIANYRKKTKNVTFAIEATRDGYKMNGHLLISPATMHFTLNCNELHQVTTKNGFGLPLLKISYYRTLNVRDNYLASLLKGKVARSAWTPMKHEEITL